MYRKIFCLLFLRYSYKFFFLTMNDFGMAEGHILPVETLLGNITLFMMLQDSDYKGAWWGPWWGIFSFLHAVSTAFLEENARKKFAVISQISQRLSWTTTDMHGLILILEKMLSIQRFVLLHVLILIKKSICLCLYEADSSKLLFFTDDEMFESIFSAVKSLSTKKQCEPWMDRWKETLLVILLKSYWPHNTSQI